MLTAAAENNLSFFFQMTFEKQVTVKDRCKLLTLPPPLGRHIPLRGLQRLAIFQRSDFTSPPPHLVS